MRFLVLAMAVWMTGCAARPLDELLRDAKVNEVEAESAARRANIDIHGTVKEIAFSKHAETETSGIQYEGRVEATTRSVEKRQPYVELAAADGSVVLCYLMVGETAKSLRRGEPAHFVGRLDQFIRNQAGEIVGAQMKGCEVR